MKVKRYVGITAHEAIQKARDELGQDAIILNTRKLRRKGLKGWFSKPLTEVVAALDDVLPSQGSHIINNSRFFEKVKLASMDKANEKALRTIEQKIDTMESMVQRLVDGIHSRDTQMHVNLPPACVSYYHNLIKNDVQEDIAKAIITRAYEMNQVQKDSIDDCIRKVMLEYLGKSQPLSFIPQGKKVVIFLGPTGVGKTTTLAKLAALFSIQQKKKVGLITADTYRIAAIDQLKIYAEILGIPLSIAYNPREVQQALEFYNDKEIVLIDTAGKSLKDKEHEKEINELIHYSKADEIYLVINTNTSHKGCKSIIERYQFIEGYKFLFTKTDEAASLGIIMNCCFLTGKPLSYITIGQNVPDDIIIADPNVITDQLIGSVEI